MNPEPRQHTAILVVEDNPANQMLIEAVLLESGYAISLASSAAEALESIEHRMPDLILMDIELPGQDGLSLTRKLKADPSTASIPVVALTANAMGGDRERSLEAGCIGYISKPYDTRSLGREIAAFLAAAQQGD
jgi:CheY-like chemotaxis protein